MPLVVYAFGTYLCNTDLPWRDEDWQVNRLVKSLKGKAFNGYANIVGIDGDTRRIDMPSSPWAFEIFGMWGADILRSLGKGAVTLVPVPASNHVDHTVDFLGAKLARVIKMYLPGTVGVAPILAFRAQMDSSHAGGTRDQQTIAKSLVCSQTKVTGTVVLVDDVKTTGAHLRACAEILRQRGATVDTALCAGTSVWQQVVNPLRPSPEDLEAAII